jgi:hypothetical protein
LSATNTTPGWHALLAVIRGGGQTRYLYAPQPVQIISNAPPVMNLAMTGPEQLQISVSGTIGQTIVLQTSSDLLNWQPLATNTLTSAMWIYTNNMPLPKLFFRATLTQ